MNIGSVSHGTMREEDLIPDFAWELEHQKPLKREHRKLLWEIKGRMEDEEYYGSEDAGYDLEALFDALDVYSPPYFGFGAHPGDGCDYGWWLSPEFEDDFDGLKVDDLAEVPAGYVGEVLVVSDHGNMSLYRKSRNGRMVAVWGIL